MAAAGLRGGEREYPIRHPVRLPVLGHDAEADRRQWRDRDPSVIAKVQDGFQHLYPDRGAGPAQ